MTRYKVGGRQVVYPKSAAIRSRIRAGEQIAHEDRGEWRILEPGKVYGNIADDVLPNMLERGLVEVAPDDD